MDMIFSLMGITFVLVIIIACIFIAAIRGGQFEDMEGPAWRVVLDEDNPLAKQSSSLEARREDRVRSNQHERDGASGIHD